MTSSAAGARRDPPAGLGDGGANEIWAALIGAVAVIAAALITVYLTRSHASPAGPQLGISSIRYPMVNGRRVIEVRGTVQDLGAGEAVYAFAGQQTGFPPWYPGGPAAISSGLWTAYITGLPASGGNYSVWAGVASPPPPCTAPACPPVLQQLAARGPHAPRLIRVTPARHAVLPPS